MAIVVEDGSIISGANSFISLADANTYFTANGNPTQWSGATDPVKEGALLAGAKYLRLKFTYKGSLEDLTQALPFPRSEFFDSEGRTLCGTGVIPQDVIDAQCELALRHIIQDLFLNTNPSSDRITSKTIGDSSESYDTKRAINVFALINDLLNDYVLSSKSGIVYMKKGG